MSRVGALAAVLGLCAVGVLIGALGVHLYHAHGHGDRDRKPPRPHDTEAAVRHLERELDLSEDQREEVRQILEDARRKADALRAEMLPRLHEQMSETREQLHSVLTEEQLERFDRMHRDHRRLAERFLLGHGDHPAHP